MSTRHPIRSLVIGILGACLGAVGGVRADWDFSQPGDPSRQWNVAVKSSVGYDDNIFTLPNNPIGCATETLEADLDAKLPPGQTSGELRYTYDFTYRDLSHIKPDQSHSLDANVTHAFTPRLTASVSDSFRDGLEPALVGGLITRERGDYLYDAINASLSYEVTPRWILSVNQAWDIWSFDEQDQAVINNRNDYTTTASATLSLDARTFIGGNYSYSLTEYAFSSTTNAVRNSDSQAVYVSFSHQFSPLLSLQSNVGAELAGFGGGASEASPYLSLGVTYNFGALSTLSAGATYNIQSSEVAQFDSSDQLGMYLAAVHHFTPKFSSTLNFNYTIATYRNANPLLVNPFDITQSSSVEEDSWSLSFNANYDFTPWCGAFATYTHQEVISGFDNPITGFFRSFDRNQYSLGFRLTY